MFTHPVSWCRFAVTALFACVFLILSLPRSAALAQDLEPINVEGQPLAGNVQRLLQALRLLGTPLPAKEAAALEKARQAQDVTAMQKILDPHVLVVVSINPESRVKAKRGPAKAELQQGGHTPVLVKVVNEGTVTKVLSLRSPQALPIYAQGNPGKITDADVKNRFLDVEMFLKPPMTNKLSGLQVEYAIALIHSNQAGKREATLMFDVGQGSQDLGFRAEVPILFHIQPAIPVKLFAVDYDGQLTTARYTFTDKNGRIYPLKEKRLAPDFFFQSQVYRHPGGVVLLPPGELTMEYGRGPEYHLKKQKIIVPEKGELVVKVKLERWTNPRDYGWYSGDHHIHAAGCAHYTNPTEGVFADDMFLHVKGEGMNVGCNLTWGPCFDFQRQFFTPEANKVSEPFTVLKYDIEVSGFGSQALGHVCLLNLRDQEYPGSEGTKTKGWPTWTTPLMRWAKKQGAYCGYAHSGSGLTLDGQGIQARDLARRTLAQLDGNQDQKLSSEEGGKGLLPDSFKTIDANNDGLLSEMELAKHIQNIWDRQLPNYVVPPMNGIGAQEICVTAAQGLCDFISAMDTLRVPEWNCWYHVMNCGFPLKASGETDFPCISGSRVGQGRVYVQLGKVDKIDFPVWAKGLAEGRSYVSDGYAHALEFTVDGKPTGDKVDLAKPGKVTVKTRVSFASEIPLETSRGGDKYLTKGKTRLVEVIVNGAVAAQQEVPADDKEHELTFTIPVNHSSWIALRHLPQLHTNPVNVLIAGQPIRASRKSALWCLGTIEQLWRERGDPLKMPITAIDKNFAPNRKPAIATEELQEAFTTFQWAIERYRKIAAECPEGS